MATMPWFRFYNEAINDRKITRVCIQTSQPKVVVLGVWVLLLSLASASPDRGKLIISDGMPITIDELVFECGIADDVLLAIIEAFQKMNMLAFENETYSIVNWDNRQFDSDNAAARKRQYRAKKKLSQDSPGTSQGLSRGRTEQNRTESDNSHPDYLQLVAESAKNGISDISANADDQWLQYHDDFLAAYQKINPYMDQTEREAILDVAMEPKADPKKWELACVETKLNQSGIKATAGRVIEVYRAGGKWQQWQAQKYGDEKPQKRAMVWG